MVLVSSVKIGDKINYGASSQADFIQNYFLQKPMLRFANKFPPKAGIFGTKTLILALCDPCQTDLMQKHQFLAHISEILPPISSLYLHFLPSRMPGCHN